VRDIYIVLDAMLYPEPVELLQDRSYVVEPRHKSDTVGQWVMYCLETFDLWLRKAVVERITIVKFGLNKRGGYYTGCMWVESATEASKIVN